MSSDSANSETCVSQTTESTALLSGTCKGLFQYCMQGHVVHRSTWVAPIYALRKVILAW